MPDAFIQGLEDLEPGLGTVPGYDGTLSGGFRLRWKDWAERVVRLRDAMMEVTADDAEAQSLELGRCSADVAYFVAMYGWIDEPRPRKGEYPYKPFIPSAAQVEFLQWLQRKCEDPEPFDGYVSKSRGWGATRTICAFASWGWRYRAGWRGLLISRKEDLVDKPQDLNSMFGSIDFVIEHLPKWMIPRGYDKRYHRLKLMLKNPENGSQITGESTTTKAGRGARATYAIVDEAAFVPEFVMTFGTLSGTTDHRFALSTESFEEGFEWYQTWKKYEHDTDRVKQLEWWDNPWFDEYWLAEEEARWEHDPAGFIREFRRDPYSGFGEAIYPIAKDLPTAHDYRYNPDSPLLVGVDPGRADDTAVVFAQFRGVGAERELIWLDSYEKNQMPSEFYAHILTGIRPQLGDDCWLYWEPDYGPRFTARDLEFMDWLRTVPHSHMRVFCDPAGGQRPINGMSFVERLLTESKKLRQREHDAGRYPGTPKGIAAFYKELFSQNRHDMLRSSARKILPATKFAPTDGANRLRLAFMNYRMNEPGPKATGQPMPIHDEWSHLVKAAEYLLAFVDMGVAEPKNWMSERNAA
jgi:hypothetical protein